MKMSLEKIASKGQQRIPRFFLRLRENGRREDQEHRGRDTRVSRSHGWSDHTMSLCNECASQNTRTNAHIADIDTDSREQARVSERVCRNERALIIVPLNLGH